MHQSPSQNDERSQTEDRNPNKMEPSPQDRPQTSRDATARETPDRNPNRPKRDRLDLIRHT